MGFNFLFWTLRNHILSDAALSWHQEYITHITSCSFLIEKNAKYSKNIGAWNFYMVIILSYLMQNRLGIKNMLFTWSLLLSLLRKMQKTRKNAVLMSLFYWNSRITKVKVESHRGESQRRVTEECHRSELQECHRSVTEECHRRVSQRCVTEVCRSRVTVVTHSSSHHHHTLLAQPPSAAYGHGAATPCLSLAWPSFAWGVARCIHH